MKDYNRKSYIGDSYDEMMRNPTKSALQAMKLQKESEFEKPYRQEYVEMQHYPPPPPGPPGPDPDPPPPGPPVPPDPPPVPPGPPDPPPVPPDEDPYYPWWPEDPCYAFVKCSSGNDDEVDSESGCGTLCVEGMCSKNMTAEIDRWTDKPEDWKLKGGKMTGGEPTGFTGPESVPPAKFCVDVCYVGSDSDARAVIRFTDATWAVKHVASGITDVPCFIKANCCDLAQAISYSSGNPATIAANSETGGIAITVDDGCGSFNWAVSGTGFSFKYNQTTKRSNQLITVDACGLGTITVTDRCGDEATGYIRAPGEWGVVDTCVVNKGAYYSECIDQNRDFWKVWWWCPDNEPATCHGGSPCDRYVFGDGAPGACGLPCDPNCEALEGAWEKYGWICSP